MTTDLSVRKATNPLAIVSLVASIGSFLLPMVPITALLFERFEYPHESAEGFVFLLYLAGFLLGILAVATGVIAVIQISKKEMAGKGLAIAGIALGGVGLFIVPCMTITSYFLI